MLKYDKLFQMMSDKGIGKSSLRYNGFSPNLIGRLAKGEHINTVNIDKICKLLNCQPGDIMEYIPDKTKDK